MGPDLSSGRGPTSPTANQRPCGGDDTLRAILRSLPVDYIRRWDTFEKIGSLEFYGVFIGETPCMDLALMYC